MTGLQNSSLLRDQQSLEMWTGIRLDTIVNKLNCFFGRDIAFSAGSENHDVVGPREKRHLSRSYKYRVLLVMD